MNKNNENRTTIGTVNVCISLIVVIAKIKCLNCVVILFGNIIFENVYNNYLIIFE